MTLVDLHAHFWTPTEPSHRGVLSQVNAEQSRR